MLPLPPDTSAPTPEGDTVVGTGIVWKRSAAPLILELVEQRKAEIGEQVTFLEARKTKACRLLSKKKKERRSVWGWERRKKKHILDQCI